MLSVLGLSLLNAAWLTAPAAADDDPDPVSAGLAYLQARSADELTPDVVLALAEGAQTGDEWSTKEAVDAVEDLAALDPIVAEDMEPAEAARILVLVVLPTGLSPNGFDPAADGDPVDLAELVTDGEPGGEVTDVAWVVLARSLLGEEIDPALVDQLTEAQQANGGWTEPADPAGNRVDPTTTGLVMTALAASGSDAAPTAVGNGLVFLVRNQVEGGWPASRDGGGEVVPTAWAMAGIRAAGYDPDTACWRDRALPNAAAREFVAPSAFLAEAQQPDGSFGTGADATPATAAAVQALHGRWLPPVRLPAPTCGSPASSGTSLNLSLLVLGVMAIGTVGGAVVMMRRRPH